MSERFGEPVGDPAYHAGVTNLVLAGVGGQGSVLATRIVARAAELAGHDVVTAEVHGMAQRGGTVITTVRFGPEVLAPAVPTGEADFVVAFERLEALRYLSYLRGDGVLLVNDQRITPTIEALKQAEYPEDVVGLASERAGAVVIVPGLALAKEIGNAKLTSTVVLGALSDYLEIPEEAWLQAIDETVPPKTIQANHDAFARGVRWLAEEEGLNVSP